MKRQPLRLAIIEATRILADAGIASPRADAELIAAHVLGVERGRLPLVPLVDPPVIDQIGQLVAKRAKRIPLQHLTGWAPFGNITVDVGQGVFVPRPETELLLEWGLSLLEGRQQPVVVDLCTGSGALALAVANDRPDSIVYAVEVDTYALAWARRNADARAADGDQPIRLYSGDISDKTMFAELEGLVDLVLCNPPYVPVGTCVQPEVADHDPETAVFAADSGLEVFRYAVAAAARLLKPGGGLAIEHDDVHGRVAPELVRGRKVLTAVEDHVDLLNRPRFVTALRC